MGVYASAWACMAMRGAMSACMGVHGGAWGCMGIAVSGQRSDPSEQPLPLAASTLSIIAPPPPPPPLQVQSPEQVDKTVASWVLQLRVMAVVAASELVLAASIWPSPVDEEVFSAVMAKVSGSGGRSLLGVGIQV